MNQQHLHDASTSLELRSQPATAESPPIHLLPMEVLLKIFGHRVEEDTKGLIRARGACYGSTDQLKGPWPLSKVCRAWRNTVISTPTFWCNIICSSDSFISMRKIEGTLRLVKLQLKRSRSFGLNIRMYGDIRYLGWATISGRMLATLIARRHRRWKEFTLEDDRDSSFHNAILSSGVSLPLSFPLLEYLELKGDHRRLPMGYPQLIESSSLAPALERASFVGCHPSPNFPWERLRILSISDLRSSFVHILPQLTHLENMTIQYFYSQPSSQSPRITLPKLETLVIKPGGGWILDLIRSPALEELSMQHEPIESIFEQVITFVNVSRCSVETFSCLMKTGVQIELGRLLETMPELCTLSLTFAEDGSHPYPDETTFQAFRLLRKQDNVGLSMYYPLLESLSIGYVSSSARMERGHIISSIVDVLEKRWGVGSWREPSGGKQLKSAVLAISDWTSKGLLDLSDDHKRRLSALKIKGMDLTVEYDSRPLSIE